jgi:sec-independent protein translocase protein TatB
MDILGIGTSELIFILLIAIIVLGPKEMQRAGKTVGRWLNQLVRSDGWKALQRASKEIRSIPTSLMREANLEQLKEMEQEIRNNIDPRPPVSRPNRPPPGQKPSDPAEPGLQSPDAQPPHTPDSLEQK